MRKTVPAAFIATVKPLAAGAAFAPTPHRSGSHSAILIVDEDVLPDVIEPARTPQLALANSLP